MLYIVGFGPGDADGMTLAAKAALERSEVIVGYTAYVELIRAIFPEKAFMSTPMGGEAERVRLALAEASDKTVALICGGDSQVYGLAGLALELAEPDAEIEIVPGVTSALSGGALLGAPLGHDFAVISLSDLLTPWDSIERRLRCAAEGDFVIALYTPSSKKRSGHLARACGIVLNYRGPDTVCGIAQNVGRAGETARVLTLGELKNAAVDMFTTVFIGSSETKNIYGKMVTPRGYKNV